MQVFAIINWINAALLNQIVVKEMKDWRKMMGFFFSFFYYDKAQEKCKEGPVMNSIFYKFLIKTKSIIEK